MDHYQSAEFKLWVRGRKVKKFISSLVFISLWGLAGVLLVSFQYWHLV